MVNIVKYNEDGNTTFNDVVFVESASGIYKEYHVLNSQSFWECIDEYHDKKILWYEFKRMRTLR